MTDEEYQRSNHEWACGDPCGCLCPDCSDQEKCICKHCHKLPECGGNQ